MKRTFSNENTKDSSQSNSNTVFIQNSSRNVFSGLGLNKNENIWTIDPPLLSNQCRLTNENDLQDVSDSRANSRIEWVPRSENRNCSVNSSSLFISNGKNIYSRDTSITKDRLEPKLDSYSFKKKYVKKLPLHFIDTQDWQLYLKFAAFRDSSFVQGSKHGIKFLRKYSRIKGNKVQRLLNSIYNLHQEYTKLNEEYDFLRKEFIEKFISSDSVSSVDSISLTKDCQRRFNAKKVKSKLRPLPMKIPQIHQRNLTDSETEKSQTSDMTYNDASSQTNPVLEWSEFNDNELFNMINNNETFSSYHNTVKLAKGNFSNGINNKNNPTLSSSEASLSSSKSKRTKIYDHLTRQSFLGQQSIDIVEELQTNRVCLTHKMNIINNISSPSCASPDEASQNEFLNHPNFIFNSIAAALRCATSRTGNTSNNGNLRLINLPILLDLMLPKIQTKIHQIFEECSFLNNPLEVMAELRNYNYNKNATIQYFNDTKELRGSIKEFISNNIDSRCRMVVLRCLYRNHHISEGKYEAVNDVLCLDSEKEVENMDILRKSDLKNENHFRKEINLDYTTDVNPVQVAALQAEKIILEIMSKSTDIEPGIFDNAVHDFYSQTFNADHEIYSHKIENCTYNIMKNVLCLKRSIKETKVQMSHLRRQVSSLLKALKNNINLIINLSSKQFMTDQHRGRIMLLARQVEELKFKLKDEETKRRSVYNLMQEQMGNVRVYCRCRDIPQNENVLEVQGNDSIILPILPHERFDFDNVFSSKMSQSDIYEEFKPLVMSFIDGFNVCFITYGSEASGKTYTLIGGDVENEIEHGIMQRALNTVLTEQALRTRDWDYNITACLIEIYNDNCIDILSGESGIQMYVDCGMESVYQKLKSVPITSETDVEVLLHLCRVKRKVARTALNPTSSRSHLITLIRLEGKSKIHGENIRSFMCLCDLAGFEDIIKAETQSNKILAKEAGYINKSLTAFNRVFVSLRRQDPNTVCYRDTKLTHLLKPFLTNSGKCALIITIRTDRRSLSSTQNTLRFGRETRGVSLGKARRQVNNNWNGK